MGNCRFTAMTPKGGNYCTVFHNSSLPHWRSVEKGLNFYGECSSKNCKAGKNNSEVIMPQYVREGDTFDYVAHQNDFRCPECNGCVIPYTVGFYLCSYNIYGEYKESKYAPFQTFRDSGFTNDKDQLYQYPKKKIVDWNILDYTINKYY